MKYAVGDLIHVKDIGLGLILGVTSDNYKIYWVSSKLISNPTINNVDGTRLRNSFWEKGSVRLISKAGKKL